MKPEITKAEVRALIALWYKEAAMLRKINKTSLGLTEEARAAGFERADRCEARAVLLTLTLQEFVEELI